MFSLLILLMVALAGVAGFWGLLQWQKTRSMLLLFNLLVLLTVMLHGLSAGIGHWVGVGQELRGYYILPLLLGIVALPFSLFGFAGISRASGFAWARIDWGHGIVDIIAVALLLWTLPRILSMQALVPACWQDVIWYVYAVPPSLYCEGYVPDPGLVAPLPLVPIVVVLCYLGLGAGLWFHQRWPWLLAGMAPGAVLLALPAAWGPLPQFAGEVLCAVAMVAVGVRHALSQPPKPRPDPEAEASGG